MIGFRWISNLAGAESTLSHTLPDTMGSQVDFDDKEEMIEQHLVEGVDLSSPCDYDQTSK